MSTQASKQVTWCLHKALKEIEECKKIGLRIKHRGLLKIAPDKDLARKHLAKAEHNLHAVQRFREIGFSDWSAAGGFYCMYHCFLALAAAFGYESRNQTCTIALIESLKEEGKINLEQKFIDALKSEEVQNIQESSIIEMREDYTYGIEVSFQDKTRIDTLIKMCQELIAETKTIIFTKK